MTVRRTLIAALAAAAVIAPAAQARPADAPAPVIQTAAGGGQDLRTPDARDAAVTQHRGAVIAPGAPVAGSAGQLPPAGPPIPITAAAPEPATDDPAMPVIPLVAGLLGVMAAALAVRYGMRRSGRRTHIAA